MARTELVPKSTPTVNAGGIEASNCIFPAEVHVSAQSPSAFRRRPSLSISAGLALALCLIVVPQAFAQKITTEFDEGVDFSKFKTFTVREGQLNSRSPALNSELTRKRVEAEIERALTARGLKKATGPSDLNVF